MISYMPHNWSYCIWIHLRTCSWGFVLSYIKYSCTNHYKNRFTANVDRFVAKAYTVWNQIDWRLPFFCDPTSPVVISVENLWQSHTVTCSKLVIIYPNTQHCKQFHLSNTALKFDHVLQIDRYRVPQEIINLNKLHTCSIMCKIQV